MKRTLSVLAVASAFAGVALAQPPGSRPGAQPGAQPGAAELAQPAPELTPELKQNASYAVGVSIAKNLQEDKESLDIQMVMRGLQEGLSDQPLQMTDEQMSKVLSEFNLAMMQRAREKASQEGVKNQQEEQQIMAANAKQPNVKLTASGLQYQIVTPGAGPTPDANDMVSVHYHGTFADGTVFDSSVNRGQPLDLPVDGVIDGWSEALQMMKVGEKRKLWVPARLAYGDNARPPIPPSKMLIFDVELLGVKPQPNEGGAGAPGTTQPPR